MSMCLFLFERCKGVKQLFNTITMCFSWHMASYIRHKTSPKQYTKSTKQETVNKHILFL